MGLLRSIKEWLNTGADKNKKNHDQEFQKKIGYIFKNPELLKIALTHRSFAKSGDGEWLPSNERLEFLGDSVLGVVVSDSLYRRYPQKLEGGLTKLKSLLVNETTLHITATQINLGEYILLSPEEDRAGGRKRASINSDALEAVIGAIFLDGGLGAARQFVEKYILSQIEKLASDKAFRNFKGDLLEYMQGRSEGTPRYEVVCEKGPDHDKVFTIEVYADNTMIGCGKGLSKKDAEQKAAANALSNLKIE